jgi:serine/threonine-protein kinase HipA
VGGDKNGFDRNTFMTAFIRSGIPSTVANKIIERMKSFLPNWEALIDESFLPDKIKTDYYRLLSKRIEVL